MNSKAKACGSGVRAEQGFGSLPPVFIRYADLGDVLSRWWDMVLSLSSFATEMLPRVQSG